TDRGNALRLVRRHGDGIRYVHPWKKWLAWDGARWRCDDTGALMLAAKRVIAEVLREANRKIAELVNGTTDTEVQVNGPWRSQTETGGGDGTGHPRAQE